MVQQKGDKIATEAVLNNESKYRLKNSELKLKCQQMQEDMESLNMEPQR